MEATTPPAKETEGDRGGERGAPVGGARKEGAPPAAARSGGNGLVARLGAWIAGDAEVDARSFLVAAALVLFGVFWRFVRLGYPTHFTFDEHHFVENARNYIRGRPDWNDHPPLAKLVLVPSMLAFGDNSFAWRLPAALLGCALIALAYLTAAELFSDRRAGIFAAAFVAADGLFISYSRTALPDTPMSAFMLAALCVMLCAERLPWFAAAALLLGLGVATKWIAGCLFLVVPWLLRRKNHSPLHAIWMLGVVAAVYVGVSWFGLAITHKPGSLAVIAQTNWDLLKHHAGFTDWKNPADSRWYTWPLLLRPVLLNYEKPGSTGSLHAMSTVGNPILWYATTFVFAVTIDRCARALWAALHGRAPLARDAKVELFVLATAVALILQWIVTQRESYIWHYFGAYYLGLVLLAGKLAGHVRRRAGAVFLFVSLAAVTAVVYSPVWTEGAISREQYETLMFMPGWR